jgi:hypothetical protein
VSGNKRELKKLAKQEAAQKRKQIVAEASKAVTKAVPPAVASPVPIDNKLFHWKVSEADHAYEGDWSWDLSKEEWLELLTVLSDLSRKTWGEVKAMTVASKSSVHKRHHSQPVASLCKAARDQWTALQLEDRAEAFRLRHGNVVRIWGYLHGPEFVIVWYDRNHRVYPLEPN